MEAIIYKKNAQLSEYNIKTMYEDAGWTDYAKDLGKLMKAIEASLMVITAWHGENLVGLIRAVGDGVTILYIQDILVLKSYKRKGIGSSLLNRVLEHYKDVRQKVLLTDESEETRGFYEANGFTSCDKGSVVAFARFN